MKRVNVHMIIDEQTEYRLASALRVETSSSGLLYDTQSEIMIPGRNPILVSGNLMYRGLRRSTIELNIENVFEQPLLVSGK